MTVKIKWLGHAGFKIEAAGKILFMDPHETNATEKADILLISHSHYDHCDPKEAQKLLKEDTLIIAPADCKLKTNTKIKSLRPNQETSLNGFTIKAVEAYNFKRFRSPGIPYHPKGFGVGYLIKVENKTIYHAGDTDFIPEMKNLGTVDVALLPSGDTYTMDNADAAEAAIAINPETAVPMHRWKTNPDEFDSLIRRSTSNIEVRILSEGDEFSVI